MKFKTKELILTAFFASLTSIGAYITIPIPYVPITLQFFFCALSGLILGPFYGMLSQIVYALIGLLGIPVFASGVGGLQSVFRPSFGYVIGFIFAAYIVGFIKEKYNIKSFIGYFITSIIGLLVVYIFGVPYLYIILRIYMGKILSFLQLIKIGIINFIVGDLIKTILVAYLAYRINKSIIKYNNR